MNSDYFLWLSPEQWAGVSALATALLVLLTGSYAWLTRQALKESRNSTDAAKESAAASTKAAEAAVAAAEALLRQAEAMERTELVNVMPMVQSIASSVDSRVRPPQFTVKTRNSGRGTAINITLRMFEGQLPGPAVVVRLPLDPGTASIQEEKLGYPTQGGNLRSPYLIEARYQNSQGREFASQTHPDGMVDYYLLVRDMPGGTPRYEELAKAPIVSP